MQQGVQSGAKHSESTAPPYQVSADTREPDTRSPLLPPSFLSFHATVEKYRDGP